MNRRRFLGLSALVVAGLTRGKLPHIPAPEALPAGPAYLFPEGSFLYLDGGTLDLGLIRDTAYNSTNNFKVYGETFEALARADSRITVERMHDPSAIRVISTAHPALV